MTMSIYNEKNYLLNPEVSDAFKNSYLNNKARWDLEKSYFDKTLDMYDELIVEIAKLLRQIGYNSSLDCSIMLSQIIKSGFLSHDLYFRNKPAKLPIEISSRLGTTIVTGEGCCRNFADMLMDVFEVLDFPTDKLYCYQGSIRRGLNKQANHVINLVDYDGNIYGIDLFNNNRLYRFKTPLVMREVSSLTAFKLLYKPYYEITMGEADLTQIKQRLRRFQDYSTRPTINPFIYEDDIRYDAIQRIKEEGDALYQFHKKTKVLKKEIAHNIINVQK